MSTAKGYYSLVQFCPDPARAEAANVGVLLFCPDRDFIEVKITKDNDRIRRFFHGETFDWKRVKLAKNAIAHRLKADRGGFGTLDDLRHFVHTRGNEVVLTEPRPVKVWEPTQDLERLYDDLVSERSKAKAQPAFVSRLDRALRQPTLANRMRYDLDITVPIANRKLKIPYAYNNEVLNLVTPQPLSTTENQATNTAMRLAAEGQMIAKHGVDGTKAKLAVIFGFQDGGAQPDLQNHITRLFDEFDVSSYSEDRIDEFTQLVEEHAHC